MEKNWWIWWWFLFCSLYHTGLFAQIIDENLIVDSIFTTLDTVDGGKEKILILHQQANYIYDFAPFTKQFLDSALHIAIAEGLDDEVAICYLNLMQFCVVNSQLDSAERHYETGINLPIVQADPVHLSDFYLVKATILKNEGNVKGAVEYFLNALSLLEQPGLVESRGDDSDKIGIDRSRCILHNNLANLYKDIQDFTSAVTHYDQSYDILLALDEKAFAGTVLMNKAGLYYDHEIYDTAYLLQVEAKQLKEAGEASKRSIAMSDLNIGSSLLGLGQYNEARHFIEGALNDFLNMENPTGLANAYVTRGDLNVRIAQYSDAIKDCESGKKLAVNAGILDLQEKACDCLYMAYKGLGNYRHALENHIQLKLLNDSLRNDANTKYITRLEMQYDFDREEEKRLVEENQAKILQREKDTRTRRILVILLILLLTSFIVGYLLYQNFQIKKKSESDLSLKNAEISKALQEKELLLREIHHRVKNNLQVISSLLRLQSRYLDDGVALDAISAGQSRVQSMALLHENLYQHDNFTGVNVQKYFDRLIEGLFSTLNVSPDRIKLEKNIAPMELDVDLVVPLGLITNELISNALKHAFDGQRSGIVNVQLYEEDQELHLWVSDDGKGMPTNFFESKSNSFGHKLIKAFAMKLKGHLEVINSNGTKVHLLIKNY